MPGHVVTGAHRASAFVQKQTIRAGRLINVVLHDDRLPQKQSQTHGQKRGAGQMDDISAPEEPEERQEIGLAQNPKRQRGVIPVPPRRRRNQRDLRVATGRGVPCQALRKRHHMGLKTANHGGECVGIDDDFHCGPGYQKVQQSAQNHVAAGLPP
jgi:hypothetical protein